MKQHKKLVLAGMVLATMLLIVGVYMWLFQYKFVGVLLGFVISLLASFALFGLVVEYLRTYVP